MSNFLLATKRQLVRYEAPYNENFFCTLQGKGMYGIWLNVDKLRAASEDERLEVFKEILQVID